MLVKLERTVTYVCPVCGLTHFKNISFFDFSGKSEVSVKCTCKKSHLGIIKNKHNKYNIIIPCICCNSQHKSSLTFYEMWMKPLNIINCRRNKVEICYIGNDNEIIRQLDLLEAKKDHIAATIGYKKLFNNSTVMLEAINRIHDLAEQGNIMCECENKSISIFTLKDRIILQCTRCGGVEIISAKDNLDLKKILQKEEIVLYKQKQYI